jgi:hypothetical protein
VDLLPPVVAIHPIVRQLHHPISYKKAGRCTIQNRTPRALAIRLARCPHLELPTIHTNFGWPASPLTWFDWWRPASPLPPRQTPWQMRPRQTSGRRRLPGPRFCLGQLPHRRARAPSTAGCTSPPAEPHAANDPIHGLELHRRQGFR